ncbi:hypothetical protein RV06_GL000192 [Enterococcus haemoperoxidus]|nr:hypothetical protein RV06_GL000192 [Enterococcus haemoperoxidus]
MLKSQVCVRVVLKKVLKKDCSALSFQLGGQSMNGMEFKMKKKIYITGLFIIMGLLVVPKIASALGEYVYLPSDNLRTELSRDVADPNNLFEKYGIFEKDVVQNYTGTIVGELSDKDFNLEGVNEFKSAHKFSTEGGTFKDLRSLGELEQLKELELYDINLLVPNLEDLSKLSELERIYFEGHEASFTDISALSNLPQLKEIKISLDDNKLATYKISKSNPSLTIVDPVTLSSQFKNAKVEYSSFDENVTISSEGILEWENIPTDTKELHFEFLAEVEDGEAFYSFRGQTTIPITWNK